MSRRPFSLLQACFYLLAIVVLIMMVETLVALAGCVWIVAVDHKEPLGACQSMGALIRDIFSELLTAILALLLAARNPPPPES